MGKNIHKDFGPWFTPSPVVERLWFDDKRADGKVVKFEVAFRPVGMDEATFADPEKQANWLRARDWFHQDWDKTFQPDDIVVAIGTPYLEVPITD